MGQPSSSLYVVLAVVIIAVRLLPLLFPRGSGARKVLRWVAIAVSVGCLVYLYWAKGKL